jgi:hypothetical protein
MVLCERCAAIMAEDEREERAIAAVLPSHLHLYDFGDGVTTMPMPDFSGSGSYLTTSAAYLYDDRDRFLAVEIKFKKRKPGETNRLRLIDSTDFLDAIADGAKRFEADAKPRDPSGRLPMPVVHT